jgi:hypothetical protein
LTKKRARKAAHKSERLEPTPERLKHGKHELVVIAETGVNSSAYRAVIHYRKWYEAGLLTHVAFEVLEKYSKTVDQAELGSAKSCIDPGASVRGTGGYSYADRRVEAVSWLKRADGAIAAEIGWLGLVNIWRPVADGCSAEEACRRAGWSVNGRNRAKIHTLINRAGAAL